MSIEHQITISLISGLPVETSRKRDKLSFNQTKMKPPSIANGCTKCSMISLLQIHFISIRFSSCLFIFIVMNLLQYKHFALCDSAQRSAHTTRTLSLISNTHKHDTQISQDLRAIWPISLLCVPIKLNSIEMWIAYTQTNESCVNFDLSSQFFLSDKHITSTHTNRRRLKKKPNE